ncbi:type 1 fimbrial protein [Pseudomonas sp. TH41]|uniref:type 1 fimbrial protein n=1 Tax=Pseudomonas sp. TH41 TaxID=2796405 RepID=UPI001914782B|nr:type 1 fimbrial protein [Pseudomonas sp. TH41]MBK5356548.1 type 1 fimbrial protein [Pseudomonas sp. TH41]
MKRKIVVSSVLLFIPLAVSAAPQTVSDSVHFVGQIVNSGCAVSHAGPAQFAESQRIQVASGLDLDVDTYRNACGHGPIPFSTAFESLKADEARVVSTPEKGIVTITYL